jgi:hypothetical protein
MSRPSDFDSCASHLSVDVNELREKNSLQLLPPQPAHPVDVSIFSAPESKAEENSDGPVTVAEIVGSNPTQGMDV